MTAPAAWPDRYRVVVQAAGGPAETLSVVTWADEAKARRLARDAYARRHADAGDAAAAVVVTVERLGPAPRAADGTVGLAPDDVIDRREF